MTTDKIILYGSPTCGMVPAVRHLLDRAQTHYQYIDISQNTAARQRVQEINQGYASVPTLVFPDGSTLTEPALGELKAKLDTLGYELPRASWQRQVGAIVRSGVVRGIGILLLAVGAVRSLWVLAIVGFLILLAWGVTVALAARE